MADSGENGTAIQIDVKQTPAYRGLKAAVIILGVLIVVALAILIAGFAAKLGGHKQSGATAMTFSPPPGARLISAETSGDRLVLHLRSAAGDEMDIVDIENGRLVARLKFAPSAP